MRHPGGVRGNVPWVVGSARDLLSHLHIFWGSSYLTFRDVMSTRGGEKVVRTCPCHSLPFCWQVYVNLGWEAARPGVMFAGDSTSSSEGRPGPFFMSFPLVQSMADTAGDALPDDASAITGVPCCPAPLQRTSLVVSHCVSSVLPAGCC